MMIPTPTPQPVYRVVHQPRPGHGKHNLELMMTGALLAFVVFPLSIVLPFIWLAVIPLLVARVRHIRRRDAAAYAERHFFQLAGEVHGR